MNEDMMMTVNTEVVEETNENDTVDVVVVEAPTTGEKVLGVAILGLAIGGAVAGAKKVCGFFKSLSEKKAKKQQKQIKDGEYEAEFEEIVVDDSEESDD